MLGVPPDPPCQFRSFLSPYETLDSLHSDVLQSFVYMLCFVLLKQNKLLLTIKTKTISKVIYMLTSACPRSQDPRD